MRCDQIIPGLMLLGLFSCQQEIITPQKNYGDDIYALKEYKVERHPPVVRRGFGMDIYHDGNSSLDTLYFRDDRLPPYHPENPVATGSFIKKTDGSGSDSILFEYDLLFYNEFVYNQNDAGDYNSTGYPVIFLYTDPGHEDRSVRAVMVGQGIGCFNLFNADSIAVFEGGLKADPMVDLGSYRTELHTATVDGFVMLQPVIEPVYQSLVIGNKFRPGTGGVFSLPDVSDDAQIDLQPVFLIKTREGLYAKLMVTRFKGVGVDTQRLSLQWQAIR